MEILNEKTPTKRKFALFHLPNTGSRSLHVVQGGYWFDNGVVSPANAIGIPGRFKKLSAIKSLPKAFHDGMDAVTVVQKPGSGPLIVQFVGNEIRISEQNLDGKSIGKKLDLLFNSVGQPTAEQIMDKEARRRLSEVFRTSYRLFVEKETASKELLQSVPNDLLKKFEELHSMYFSAIKFNLDLWKPGKDQIPLDQNWDNRIDILLNIPFENLETVKNQADHLLSEIKKLNIKVIKLINSFESNKPFDELGDHKLDEILKNSDNYIVYNKIDFNKYTIKLSYKINKYFKFYLTESKKIAIIIKQNLADLLNYNSDFINTINAYSRLFWLIEKLQKVREEPIDQLSLEYANNIFDILKQSNVLLFSFPIDLKTLLEPFKKNMIEFCKNEKFGKSYIAYRNNIIYHHIGGYKNIISNQSGGTDRVFNLIRNVINGYVTEAFKINFISPVKKSIDNFIASAESIYRQAIFVQYLTEYITHISYSMNEITAIQPLLPGKVDRLHLKDAVKPDNHQKKPIDAAVTINGGYFPEIGGGNDDPTNPAVGILFRGSIVYLFEKTGTRVRKIKNLWPEIPAFFHDGIDAAVEAGNNKIELIKDYQSVVVKVPK